MKRSRFFPILLIIALLQGGSTFLTKGAATARSTSVSELPVGLADLASRANQTSLTFPDPATRPTPGNWRCYPDGAPDPCHNGLFDVDLVSSTDGWAVGGSMLRWNGKEWIDYGFSPIGMLTTIDMLTSTEGWAAGWGGIIHWDGESWIQTLPDAGHSFLAISMISPTDGWAAGDMHFHHWDGKNWIHYDSFGFNIYALDMVTSRDVWAAGEHGYLLHWDGRSWNQIPSPAPSETIYGLAMFSSYDGWASTSGGHVLHWDGRTWSIAAKPGFTAMVDIAFSTADDGWMIGRDGSMYHYDGKSWEGAGLPTLLELSALALSGTTGWAVGERSVLVRREGDTWRTVADPLIGKKMKLAANSPTDIWAYDRKGLLMHWDGLSWNSAPGPFGYTISELEMLSPVNGWAAVYFGGLLHWNGVSWSTYPFPDSTWAWEIDMTSPVDGWATTSLGLLHWDGTTWKPLSNGLSSCNALEILSPTDGWCLGYINGANDQPVTPIYSWDGLSWRDTGLNSYYLDMIEALGKNDAWAAGKTVLHWDGSSWQPLPGAPAGTFAGGTFSGISTYKPQDLWLASGPDFFHWDGTTWEYAITPDYTSASSLVMFSALEGWAVTEAGALINYDGRLPTLLLSALDGQPGSTFQVTGANFPPGYLAEVKANGQILGTVTPDTAGSFIFLVRTTQAGAGSYFLSVTAPGAPASMSRAATILLHLDPQAPRRDQVGTGPTFELPAGITYTQIVYYPVIGK